MSCANEPLSKEAQIIEFKTYHIIYKDVWARPQVHSLVPIRQSVPPATGEIWLPTHSAEYEKSQKPTTISRPPMGTVPRRVKGPLNLVDKVQGCSDSSNRYQIEALQIIGRHFSVETVFSDVGVDMFKRAAITAISPSMMQPLALPNFNNFNKSDKIDT